MKQDLESNRHSADSARGNRAGPRLAPPISPADKSSRLLGLEPSVKIEIKASPAPLNRPRLRQRCLIMELLYTEMLLYAV
jgi:hypothetical protein